MSILLLRCSSNHDKENEWRTFFVLFPTCSFLESAQLVILVPFYCRKEVVYCFTLLYILSSFEADDVQGVEPKDCF